MRPFRVVFVLCQAYGFWQMSGSYLALMREVSASLTSSRSSSILFVRLIPSFRALSLSSSTLKIERLIFFKL